MQTTCIAIVDATRARLFTFERTADVEGVHEELSEHTDLVNPARRLTPAQLFSDTRTNSNRAGHLHYGSDDHVDAHLDELDAEFARSITGAIERAIRETAAHRLIVCASPRMLGQLRAAELRHDGIVIDELARDFVKLTPPQIHARLVEHGLLPAPPARPGLRQEA